jgi:hypothetical protein
MLWSIVVKEVGQEVGREANNPIFSNFISQLLNKVSSV